MTIKTINRVFKSLFAVDINMVCVEELGSVAKEDKGSVVVPNSGVTEVVSMFAVIAVGGATVLVVELVKVANVVKAAVGWLCGTVGGGVGLGVGGGGVGGSVMSGTAGGGPYAACRAATSSASSGRRNKRKSSRAEEIKNVSGTEQHQTRVHRLEIVADNLHQKQSRSRRCRQVPTCGPCVSAASFCC